MRFIARTLYIVTNVVAAGSAAGIEDVKHSRTCVKRGVAMWCCVGRAGGGEVLDETKHFPTVVLPYVLVDDVEW